MAKVKFGKSSINENGAPINRQWGKNLDKTTYWKFGEPSQFYYLNSLYDYLPRFIVKNELCIAILTAIAISMTKWAVKLKSLLTYKVNGDAASIKYANSDLQMFICDKLSPLRIVESIKSIFTIHEQRGTFNGIREDIKRLNNDSAAELKYFGPEECGWFLDVTYPEFNNLNQYNYKSNVYLDLDNMLDIDLKNRSGLTEKLLKKIIREEFVPLVTNIRLTILKPHPVKWGDIVNGFKIKFGTFKFGETVNE